MPEHVHLLMSEPASANPSTVLQVLKQKVSRALRGKAREPEPGQFLLEFARSELDDGGFWQRRFYDFNVWSGIRGKEQMEYINVAPVERMLGERADEWLGSRW